MVFEEVAHKKCDEGLIGHALAVFRGGAHLQGNLGAGDQNFGDHGLELLVVGVGLLAVVGRQDGHHEPLVGTAAIAVHVDDGLCDSGRGTAGVVGGLDQFQVVLRVVFDFGGVLEVLHLGKDQQEISAMVAI